MAHAPCQRGCVAILLSALLLAGCDGGLFGTGGGSVDADNGTVGAGAADPTSGPGDSAETTGGTNGGSTDGTTGDDGGSVGNGENVDSDAGTAPPPGTGTASALENTLSVQPGPPTLDLLNFTRSDQVSLDSGIDHRVLASVGIRERLFDITLPPDSAPLRVVDRSDDSVLAEYSSVSLVDGSQTTVLVREPVGDVPAVVALQTRVAPDVPSLALVRFVASVGPVSEVILDARLEGETLPGVSLGTPSYAAPQSAYVSVEPGEYVLRDNPDFVSSEVIRLEAGEVVSLYTLDGQEAPVVEIVVDGSPEATGYLDFDAGVSRVDVLHEGDGLTPSASDTVTVHYTGRLGDGTMFDSSYARGQPSTFPLAGVIEGFRDGVLQMPVGSRYRLVIPPQLAYGAAGSPPDIPADATLIFEIDLLAIVP